MILKDHFILTCLQFSEDQLLIENFWNEIEKKHSEKKRHYHNLIHLENMFSELIPVKDKISDFTVISFSVFYHDVIYNAASKSNEEKSAEFALARLETLDLSKTEIQKVYEQILATKSHQKSGDQDTNFLLDADLSVLGKDFEAYVVYTQQIRKEYSIYPDFLYRPGRRKVLEHFLQSESIFKTDYFKEKYETRARENIASELKYL